MAPPPQMPRAARAAAAVPAAPPAVSRPLAPPPAPRAARAAPAAPERLPEPPSGGAFAPAGARRPTRPVSPLPVRGAAASDAARYLSALAAFGGGGARGGPAGADDGDGHSTPGSFTPSEASDDDDHGHTAIAFGGGKAPPSYDYRDAVQHRHDVRPPPSELGDSGSESGVGEAASDDESDAGGTHPRHRQVYGGGDDADFSDVSLEGAEEPRARRAPPAQAAPAPQLMMKPMPSPLAAWDVFRGALGVAPPRPQPVRVLPAAPQPQQQRPLAMPQQRPRAVSASPAARFGRDRSASPPRRPASPRGVPVPMASPAPSAALAAPRPASAVWAPPDIAPDEHTEAPLRTAVLIVDPATEWRALAAAAAALGHVPVAVLAAVGDDPALSATAAALAALGGDRGAFALVLRARSAGGGRDVYSLAEEARNAAAVARLRWVAVLPGGRAGVESADALAAMLGLRHAPLAMVAARRDKAALGDALAAAGVPRVPAAPCRWPEDAWRFGRAAGYPILLRDPVQEGPEAGAWLCRTDAQAGAAVGRAMQLTRDPAMRRRRYVLAERCISGDAFLAGVFAMPGLPSDGNTVSVERIYVTDLWHFQPHRAAEAVMDAAARELEAQAARKAAPAGAKAAAAAPGARERERARASAGALNSSASGASSEPVLRRAGGTASAPYDQAVLVDATLPEYAELVSHARRVAAAAGLAHGPGHVKLRCEWTPGRGASRPLAVLFSPTFAPGGFAALAAAAGDDDTVHPGEAPAWDPFAAAVAAAGAGGPLPEPPEPQPRLHARIVFVAAPPVAGRLTAWDGEEELRGMRSYESHELLAKPGDRVAPVAEPGRNALAAVRLLHEEWEAIEADTAAVLSGALRVRITPGGAAGAQTCNQQ